MTLIDDKPDTECWHCEKPRVDGTVYCEEHMDGGAFCLSPICTFGPCVCNNFMEVSDDTNGR